MLQFDTLLALSKEKGIDDIQMTKNSSEELVLKYFNGQMEQNETSQITSCTISALVNGQKAVYMVEDLNMAEADIVEALYENASHLNSEETSEIFAGSASYPVLQARVSDFHEIPMSEKIALLASIEKKIREKESRVAQIPELVYEESVSSTSIQNSKGLSISKRNEDAAVMFELVAAEGEEMQVGFKVDIKNNMKDIDVDKMIDDAIYDAVSMFGAKSMESGEYPVIIENEAMISLLSSFSGMFTGETHIKKISPIQDKLGEKIFSEKITIKDMPLKEDAIIRQPFDGEGVACFDKTVVENGVFKLMLQNLKTAKAFGTESTGNAFGGGISGCNLFIEAGSLSKDELIASTDKGLLLTHFDGLHAGLNAISGDMSLKTSGYYIEDGKIVKPVTLIIMAANFLDMMNDVAEIGSDMKINYGGIGAPSIKFNKISISGT